MSEQHHSPVGAGRLVTHGGTEQISSLYNNNNQLILLQKRCKYGGIGQNDHMVLGYNGKYQCELMDFRRQIQKYRFSCVGTHTLPLKGPKYRDISTAMSLSNTHIFVLKYYPPLEGARAPQRKWVIQSLKQENYKTGQWHLMLKSKRAQR